MNEKKFLRISHEQWKRALYKVMISAVSFLASIVLVMIFGTPGDEALTGVIASVGSVGPGIGELGSLDNYSAQLPSAKMIYTLDMFLGRLEIYPLLVVLSMIFRRRR